MTDVAKNIGVIRDLLIGYRDDGLCIFLDEFDAAGLISALTDIEADARALTTAPRQPALPLFDGKVIYLDFSNSQCPPAPGGTKGGAA